MSACSTALALCFFLQLNITVLAMRAMGEVSDTSPAAQNQNVSTMKFTRILEAVEFLFPQNYARAQVGELPLIWDTRVESYARWWAEQRRSDCNMIHSHGPFGENIFWGSGQSWTPSHAVKFWVDEKYYYDYQTNSCSAEDAMCGHYTQIVWRDTRRLGCARVVCDTGDVFMTCNYDPPGNYIGQRPY